MQAIRHLLAQRRFAMLLCAATLLLKLLIPAGYMIAADHGRITIALCSGTGPVATTMHGAMQGAMPAMHGDMPGHGTSDEDHGKAEMPCAFAGLSAAALGAIDPIQLAALIAFVLASGVVAAILAAPSRPVRLRPPLRGPPVHP